jgi:hypothetical protein
MRSRIKPYTFFMELKTSIFLYEVYLKFLILMVSLVHLQFPFNLF